MFNTLICPKLALFSFFGFSDIGIRPTRGFLKPIQPEGVRALERGHLSRAGRDGGDLRAGLRRPEGEVLGASSGRS